jgi:hypothetical protein
MKGSHHETDISAFQPKENQQAWLPFENGNEKRAQGSFKAPEKRKKIADSFGQIIHAVRSAESYGANYHRQRTKDTGQPAIHTIF